jgi:tetratricopeptide (TPR) repeat protein
MDQDPKVPNLLELAVAARVDGKIVTAERIAQEVLEQAEEIGDRASAAEATCLIGECALMVGEIPEALTHFITASDLGRAASAPTYTLLAPALRGKVLAYFQLKEGDNAKEALVSLHRLGAQSDNGIELAMSEATLGRYYLGQEDLSRATQLLRGAETRMGQIVDLRRESRKVRLYHVQVQLYLADLAIAEERWSDANRHLAQTTGIIGFKDYPMTWYILHFLGRQAYTWLKLGDPTTCYRRISDVRLMMEEHQMPSSMRRILYEETRLDQTIALLTSR